MLSGVAWVWLLLGRLSEHGYTLNVEFFKSKILIKSVSLKPKPKYSCCFFSKSSGEKKTSVQAFHGHFPGLEQ
jgi:hypothetical protein